MGEGGTEVVTGMDAIATFMKSLGSQFGDMTTQIMTNLASTITPVLPIFAAVIVVFLVYRLVKKFAH